MPISQMQTHLERDKLSTVTDNSHQDYFLFCGKKKGLHVASMGEGKGGGANHVQTEPTDCISHNSPAFPRE